METPGSVDQLPEFPRIEAVCAHCHKVWTTVDYRVQCDSATPSLVEVVSWCPNCVKYTTMAPVPSEAVSQLKERLGLAKVLC